MRFLTFVLGLWLALATVVLAQQQPATSPDYKAWEKLAGQAEQILQSGDANEARLQAIRNEVVKWREDFKSGQDANATRIATLKDQIAALGPPPAEGKTESQDIADRRKALNDQLSELQAPGLNAVEAYGRADGIVQQIDAAQRAQQANALLRLVPSPLNPTNWLGAAQDGYTLLVNAADEFRTRLAGQGGWAGVREWGAIVVGYLALALLLLTRGRRWIDGAPSRLSARASERTREVVVFAVSLGQIAVPLIGVVLAVNALLSTNLFATWGRPLLSAVPPAAMVFFAGFWLTRRLFPVGMTGDSPLPLPEKDSAQARFNAAMLAAISGLHQFFALAVLPLSGFNERAAEIYRVPLDVSDGSAAIWHFPLIVAGAWFLFRLGSVLRRLSGYDSSDNPSYRIRIGTWIAVLMRVVAVLAVVLAAIGYITLANALVWPMAMSIALIGLLIVLQDFIADLYAMAKGGGKAARDSLMPLLIGLALILMSLPVFALIWGTRPNELSEVWTKLRDGIRLGGITISPTGILAFLLIFLLGYSLTRFVQGGLRNTVLPKTRIDAGGQNAIVSGVGYLGTILALILAITSAGIDLSSLAFIAGALSLGIGFGLQNIVSNFVSGIILLIERPVTVGDWIEVGGKQGYVKRISVRSTHVQTFDRTEVVVPNSDLVTQPVTNWTRNNLSGRIIVPVTVDQDADSAVVHRILSEIAEDQPTVLIAPPPVVLLRGFTKEGMNFEIRAIVSDVNGGTGVVSDINHAILRRFREAGIEMSFGQATGLSADAEAIIRALDGLDPDVLKAARGAVEPADEVAPARKTAPPPPVDDAPVADADDDAPSPSDDLATDQPSAGYGEQMERD